MSCRVLLIEDDDLVRACITLVLEAEGLEVRCAGNGEEGLRLSRSLAPDLVISDLNMPTADGYDVIGGLRKSVNTSTIPLLLITADNDTDTRARCIARGADAFLRKPFDSDELVQVVRRLVDARCKAQV